MNSLTYSPRLVRALPPLDVRGRALKAYGIFADPADADSPPSPEWLRQQVASVLLDLPEPEDHPAGFVILHRGGDGDYLLVSQWFDANMLKHWVRGSAGGAAFEPLAERAVIACVWELEVLKFERDAWVKTVLARGRLDQDSLDAYLGMTFSGWV